MAITTAGEGGRTLLLARRRTTRSRRPTRGARPSSLPPASSMSTTAGMAAADRAERNISPSGPAPRDLLVTCARTRAPPHTRSRRAGFAGKLRKYLGSAIPRATFRSERSPRSSRIHRRTERDAVLLSELFPDLPTRLAALPDLVRHIKQLNCGAARRSPARSAYRPDGWYSGRLEFAFHVRHVGRDRLYGSGSKGPCTRKEISRVPQPPNRSHVVAVVSTPGQGAFPGRLS